MSEPQLSLADPAVRACPFHAYQTLQAEAPVYFDRSTNLYVLSRYDHVRAALMDHDTFSSMTGLVQTRPRKEVIELYERKGWPPVPTLLNNDPPAHRYFRSFVDKAFNAKRAAQLRVYIERSAVDLIESMLATQGEIEFMGAFAVRLPLQVISDLVGVPREMMNKLILWADAGVELTSPVLRPERELELIELSIEFQQYFARLAEQYRGRPADNLLSDLVNDVIDDRSLTMTELLSLIQIVMAAGYETTTSAIASAVAGLIEVPDRQQRLMDRPGDIAEYVDEVIRLYAPLQGLYRRATRDVTVGDVTIPKGAIVQVLYGAANRDPEKFAAPDELDVCRKNKNQHLSFGTGIHTCVGRQLARAEVCIAIEQLLRRTSSLRFARGDRSTSWMHKPSFVTWGPSRLYLLFDPR
jgi:cytochrome P450